MISEWSVSCRFKSVRTDIIYIVSYASLVGDILKDHQLLKYLFEFEFTKNHSGGFDCTPKISNFIFRVIMFSQNNARFIER